MTEPRATDHQQAVRTAVDVGPAERAAVDVGPAVRAAVDVDPAVRIPPDVGPPGKVQGEATRPALLEALGGRRGLVDSGLPAAVFVLVNSVVAAFTDQATGLRAALVAAGLCGVVVLGLRLWRREPLQQAVSGFVGLAIAVFFAARSGEARGFFLPGIYFNIIYGAAFVGSVLVGRPLVGLVYAAVDGVDSGWRANRRLRHIFSVASIGWAAVFAARAGVQGVLYAADRPGWLAATRLLMGWPLTILAVALTVAGVTRARRRSGV